MDCEQSSGLFVSPRETVLHLFPKQAAPGAMPGAVLCAECYFACSNSATMEASGAGVSRLTMTQAASEARKAGSSS